MSAAPSDGSVRGSQRTVALTFDDGPSGWTPKILRVLREHDVVASFFVIGRQAAADPAALRAEAAAGHLVGNHSWSHRPPGAGRGWARADLDREERRTQRAIRAALGMDACWFRPPAGVVRGSLAVSRSHHLRTVLWSVDPADWQVQEPRHRWEGTTRSAQRIARRATATGGQRHPIVLLHDGGGFRGATVAALPAIITYYRKHHYRFVRVDRALPRTAPGPATPSGPLENAAPAAPPG
jgi:peptidoglycan-N-acetylglucosamine deacetylase